MTSSPIEPAQPIRLIDVARAANVAKSTAAKVLSGSGRNTRVSEDTARRVLAAAEKLNYRPDWRARALARGRSHGIAIVTSSRPGLHRKFAWSWVGADGVVEVLSQRDYTLQMLDWTTASVDCFTDGRFDGAIVLGQQAPETIPALRAATIPLVFVMERNHGIVGPEYLSQDVQGTHEMVRHLVGLGHRRICLYMGMYGNRGAFTSEERQTGFKQAMHEAGLMPAIAIGLESEELVQAWLARPVEERPTAILVYAVERVVQVLRHLWERGVRVPEDVSVATFDDPLILRNYCPPVTTMATPVAQLTAMAGEHLVSAIESGEPLTPMLHELPLKLVVRRSTGAPRGA